MRTHFVIVPALWDVKPCDLQIPVRLMNVLGQAGIHRLGDLHGVAVNKLRGWRNCGPKTLRALFDIVGRPSPNQLPLPKEPPRFDVSPESRELKSSELPMSVRLANVLRKRGIQTLGDLHNVTLEDIRSTKNCGEKTMQELLALLQRADTKEFSAPSAPFAPQHLRSLLLRLDAIIDLLPHKARALLFLRFGAWGNSARTLQDVGKRFRLSRERVRQIEEGYLSCIRRQGGRKLAEQAAGLARICDGAITPLTPQLMEEWLALEQGDGPRHALGFYAHLLERIFPQISAWPRGQKITTCSSTRLQRAIEPLLRQSEICHSTKAVFEQLKSQDEFRAVTAAEFLKALKSSRKFLVEFPNPGRPIVRLRETRRSPSLPILALSILKESGRPLPIGELLNLARERSGSTRKWHAYQTLARLHAMEEFYLVGPKVIGLREHFRLAPDRWPAIREIVIRRMKQCKRPVSTVDMLKWDLEWVKETNRQELAEILREDDRLVDLGRLLFGLRGWGIAKREVLTDIVRQILERAEEPLRLNEILARVRRFRSASEFGVSTALAKIPSVCRPSRGLYASRPLG